ncbi:MAG: ABC transporter ATP-binding protein [Candidatus Electrothrix communis]|nr:MAG: ABC transporter ATP-binding protein [Candidatus Electrothrix communis]
MKNAAVQIRDLSYSYDDIPVLTDVHLDIFPGDSASIVGPNGGGKTTLIKVILGLVSPNQGTVLVYGNQPEQERTRISYVPQHARYDPNFPISVLEVVCMGRIGNSLSGRYTRHDKEVALEALHAVNLAHLTQRSFSALSGGQRQRVLIARALAAEGDILILDEPTASLDNRSEEQLFTLLAELNKNMIILMVTHEIGVSPSFFQRVICVNNQVYVHPTSELTGELLRDMYGGDLRMIRHDHRCGTGGHEHD